MLLEKLITLKKLCMEPTTNEGNPITLMHLLTTNCIQSLVHPD